jgi:hypothetical protein
MREFILQFVALLNSAALVLPYGWCSFCLVGPLYTNCQSSGCTKERCCSGTTRVSKRVGTPARTAGQSAPTKTKSTVPCRPSRNSQCCYTCCVRHFTKSSSDDGPTFEHEAAVSVLRWAVSPAQWLAGRVYDTADARNGIPVHILHCVWTC